MRDHRPQRITGTGIKDGGPSSYAIAVPKWIAEALPREQEYVCEVTEDGILYRPVPGGGA